MQLLDSCASRRGVKGVDIVGRGTELAIGVGAANIVARTELGEREGRG